MKQVAATVISNEQLLGKLERPHARAILGSWIIWLECPELASEAKPGQFVMVDCGGECLLLRPFSIHQVNDKGIALFYAVLVDGKGTNWLSQRKRGDIVKLPIPHPSGNGFSINPSSDNLLLVAGGIGIAPLCFLAERAQKRGHEITLLLGASGAHKPSGEPNPLQLYPRELLPAGIKIEPITTSPDGLKRMVTKLIPKYIDWADQIFACGPTAMYRDMALKKRKLGLEGKPVQISLEMRMGCGRGVCYACTVRTKNGLKQVCKDGPVFDLDDIIWDELAQA